MMKPRYKTKIGIDISHIGGDKLKTIHEMLK